MKTWIGFGLALAALALTGCGGHEGNSTSGSVAAAISASPTLSAIDPAQGSELGGSTVRLRADGFADFQGDLPDVTLGGVPLSGVVAVSTNVVEGVAPAGSGSVDVVLSQGGRSASAPGAYTYRAAELRTLSPRLGRTRGGTPVRIESAWFSADFSSAPPEVLFGSQPALSVSAVSSAVVLAVAPAGVGVVDVTVRTTQPAQSATLRRAFGYDPLAPADLELSSGRHNAGLLNVAAPAAGLVLAQVRVSARVDASLDELTLLAEGTVDESTGLGDVVLYRDLNGDGALDAGDQQLGQGRAFASDNAPLSFSGLALSLQAGSEADLLVAVELLGAAKVGDVVAFRAVGRSARGTLSASGTPALVSGAARSGALQVAGSQAPSTIHFQQSANAPAPTQVAADADQVPVLALRATTTTGQIDLQGLTLWTSGTGDDARDVLAARLAIDVDGDGLIGPADTILASATPQRDDGPLHFSFWSRRLAAATSSYELLVDYTLSGSASVGATYSLSLAPSGVNAHAYYTDGGQVVSLSSAPLSGATLTVGSAASALAVRRCNVPARVVAGGVEDLALGLELSAGHGSDAEVTALTLHASGTLDDAAGIDAVRLYGDDGDGVFDASSDPLLAGPASFQADDGDLTLTVASRRLAAGQRDRLWVSVILTSGLPPGQTLVLTLDPATDVSANRAVSGGQVTGSALVTGAGQAVAVQPGPAEGKDAYLRGEGLYLNDNFGHTGSLSVGDRPTGQLGERLSFLEFALPPAPAAAPPPSKAYLLLWLSSTSGLTGASLDVEAFQVVDSGARTPWLEGRGGFDSSLDGICFDGTLQTVSRPEVTMPDVDPTPLSEVRIDAGSEDRWVRIDVTRAVQAWYAGTAPNYGLELRDKAASSYREGAVGFPSSEHPRGDLRPILLIER